MVNICVIGSGRAGLIHARNFIGRVDNAKLVALCDPVPTALEACSNELGVDKKPIPDYLSVGRSFDRCGCGSTRLSSS